MHLYKLIILLTGIIVGTFQHAGAQKLDSLLTDRQSKLQEYTQFKNNMTERTWINLVDLSNFAGEVINADNTLIWYHLDREIERNQELLEQNDKLMLEMAFLEKEAESRMAQMKEIQYLNNLFLMIILGLSIALVISLVFLFGQFRRNRHAINELERLWSMNDDFNSNLKQKDKDLHKHVRLLEIENKAMQEELAQLSDQKSAARKKLAEEIRSREKAEQEIRELTGQVRKK